MDDPTNDVRLTEAQHRVLAALRRPIAAGGAPASDEEIAAELSSGVEEVRGQLRDLYRKFGIEELPEDRRRARLAETAPGAAPRARADVPLGTVEALREAERAAAAGRPKEQRRSLGPYVTIAVLILVVIGASLAVSGIFNQGSPAPEPPTPAAFRAQVAGDCRLALDAAPATAGRDRAERARGYLGAIEALRGRLQSQVAPAVPDIALERFSTGLTTAANYTSDVAREPPPPGSRAEARYVAELSAAARQIRAGAVGYELGPDCVAIADLVASSARNAAA
jgi:hypothetical protein